VSREDARAAPTVPQYSVEWVRKVAQEAMLEAILADVHIGERVCVRIKPGLRSACWLYEPPHRIFVGDQIPANAKPGLPRPLVRRYVAKYVFHEIAHALYTERDLKAVQADLKSLGAPFRLFNLFEDGRIEDRYRVEHSTNFDWTQFETVEVASGDPTAFLFAFIQYEGDLNAVHSVAAEVGHSAALVTEVARFYQRTREAPDSKALYPVVKDWMNRFGDPPADLPGRGRDGPGEEADLCLSLLLQQDSQLLSNYEVGTLLAGGSRKRTDRKIDALANSVAIQAEDGNADLLGEATFALDRQRTQRLAARLKRAFVAEVRSESTVVPTPRISTHNFALGRPFYRRKVLKARARRKVLLVVDCSGSMQEFHIAEARALVAAFSELARQGLVSGHIVLSLVDEDERACWQRFKLPMCDEAIQRIDAWGEAEGLEFALSSNSKLARCADFVGVYTDGSIFDKPIEKDRLHARRIYTWGLYAGESEAIQRDLLRYFDRALVRADAEGLIEAMLLQR
jgi:hypothetical protein